MNIRIYRNNTEAPDSLVGTEPNEIMARSAAFKLSCGDAGNAYILIDEEGAALATYLNGASN